MEKILLQKQDGHSIPCIAEFPDEMKQIVIVIHGYDSSKESDNVGNLLNNLVPQNFGLIAYDQPGHGSEQAAEEPLTISGCLESLACVEDYIAKRFPGKEICYFGSSFGAYILAIYLATRSHRGNKAFMRCAAVNFPELAADELPELTEFDLFELYRRAKPEDVSFAFAHGEIDSVVPVSAPLAFASEFGYPITTFAGEDHPICTNPASPVKVAQLAADLYRG